MDKGAMDSDVAPQNSYSLRRFLCHEDHMEEGSALWLGAKLLSFEGEDRLRLYGQGQELNLKCNLSLGNRLELGSSYFFEVRKTHGEWGVQKVQAFRDSPVTQDSPWNPHVLAWPRFLKEVRRQLESLGLEEVVTPSLVRNPGMEVHLNPFQSNFHLGSNSHKLFLPTSPELHLKQLLCRGYTDIFEVAKVFRNDELSEHHEPEFTMLEWYRAFSDLSAIECDLKSLFRAFRPKLQFSVRSIGREWQESAENDFHRFWVEEFEPSLDPEFVTIVRDFPASEAALARVNSESWAERFEVYWRGLELANAFHELTDASEQRRRHEKEASERIERGLTPLPLDEEFLLALENRGMPPSGGIALGLDRFYMALYDVPRIQDLRSFSVKHELDEEL